MALQAAETHDPQPLPQVLAPGFSAGVTGGNPRSGQGWAQRSYLVKQMFQAAVKLVLLV